MFAKRRDLLRSEAYATQWNMASQHPAVSGSGVVGVGEVRRGAQRPHCEVSPLIYLKKLKFVVLRCPAQTYSYPLTSIWQLIMHYFYKPVAVENNIIWYGLGAI